MNKIRFILVILLMFMALLVFFMQVNRINAWYFISLYWLVLSIKNLVDFIEEV